MVTYLVEAAAGSQFSATGLPFLFWALLRSMVTPMSASDLLLKRLIKLLVLSVRHMRARVALEGPASAKRHRSPFSNSSAVSFLTNFAHVCEVAVSLRVIIFCFSLSMMSVANCSPNVSGGVTDDMGGSMCLSSLVAAQL